MAENKLQMTEKKNNLNFYSLSPEAHIKLLNSISFVIYHVPGSYCEVINGDEFDKFKNMIIVKLKETYNEITFKSVAELAKTGKKPSPEMPCQISNLLKYLDTIKIQAERDNEITKFGIITNEEIEMWLSNIIITSAAKRICNNEDYFNNMPNVRDDHLVYVIIPSFNSLCKKASSIHRLIFTCESLHIKKSIEESKEEQKKLDAPRDLLLNILNKVNNAAAAPAAADIFQKPSEIDSWENILAPLKKDPKIALAIQEGPLGNLFKDAMEIISQRYPEIFNIIDQAFNDAKRLLELQAPSCLML